MTEMVTLNAAREAQQIALLAQRPEVAPREQTQPTIQISETAIEPDSKRAPKPAEAGGQEDAQQDLAKRRDRSDPGLTGPSRARIEVRSFAPESQDASSSGTTNVVPDVSVPSGRTGAPLPQPTVSVGGPAPFNSLATSPFLNGQTQAEVEVAIAQQAVQTAAFAQPNSTESDPRAARLEAAARAVRADATVQVVNVKYNTPADVQFKKFADKAEADQGFVSGEQPVAQKYYGKGAEAVVGQFAVAEQPQKYSDKAAAIQPGGAFEDGSGETKYYDKVAQTETDFAGGDTDAQQKSMYERAQEVTTALSNEGDPSGLDATRKKYGEADVYPPVVKTTTTTDVNGKPASIQVTA